MKFKSLFFILLMGFSSIAQSFELPKNIRKKVQKEITSVYEKDNLILEVIIIPDSVNSELKLTIRDNNLFKVLDKNNHIGYAFVSKAHSKADKFDYLVLFDKDFIILKSKLLIYREDYGAEIGSKRWLKQFIGLNRNSKVEYGNEIIPISGATISARSFTIAINNLLESISVLLNKNILN